MIIKSIIIAFLLLSPQPDQSLPPSRYDTVFWNMMFDRYLDQWSYPNTQCAETFRHDAMVPNCQSRVLRLL